MCRRLQDFGRMLASAQGARFVNRASPQRQSRSAAAGAPTRLLANSIYNFQVAFPRAISVAKISVKLCGVL